MLQPFLLVGVTGLEPATAWSQTRNATNCATPRYKTVIFCFAGAKVVIILVLPKYFELFF